MAKKSQKTIQTKVRNRVEDVLKIILLGGEIHDLREWALENKWRVCDGTLYRYQAKALDLCRERIEKDHDKLFARHLMQRRTLYARAMEVADLRTALAVVKDEAELQGMYPTAKHEHAGPDGGPIQHDHAHSLTDADRASRITAIIDRARARRDGQPVSDGAALDPANWPAGHGV